MTFSYFSPFFLNWYDHLLKNKFMWHECKHTHDSSYKFKFLRHLLSSLFCEFSTPLYVFRCSLVKRVMTFRGPNRNKGEHGAAAWFLRPVTDEEAPGYSAVISQPMDFGTVKKKLDVSVINAVPLAFSRCLGWIHHV